MLPLLTTKQFIELANYHSLVGKPGVDHADVPLTMLAAYVMSFMSGEEVQPEKLMPHLEAPEQTPEEMLEVWRSIKNK